MSTATSLSNSHGWLQTPLGNYLQVQEQALFDHAVSDVFGFNALQLGMLEIDLLRNSRIPYSFKADNDAGTVRCDVSQLPFQASSIDLVLLPHALEFSSNPHQTLREAERILMPEGHVMLSGFNPISAWGMKRMTARQGYPWSGQFVPLLRIKDWLALLGFELVSVRMACYAPPFSNPSWLHRFQFMDKTAERWWPMMGGVYFIVAKKRVLGMRLIKPNWNKSKLKPSMIPAPTQKNDTQKMKHGQ